MWQKNILEKSIDTRRINQSNRAKQNTNGQIPNEKLTFSTGIAQSEDETIFSNFKQLIYRFKSKSRFMPTLTQEVSMERIRSILFKRNLEDLDWLLKTVKDYRKYTLFSYFFNKEDVRWYMCEDKVAFNYPEEPFAEDALELFNSINVEKVSENFKKGIQEINIQKYKNLVLERVNKFGNDAMKAAVISKSNVPIIHLQEQTGIREPFSYLREQPSIPYLNPCINENRLTNSTSSRANTIPVSQWYRHSRIPSKVRITPELCTQIVESIAEPPRKKQRIISEIDVVNPPNLIHHQREINPDIFQSNARVNVEQSLVISGPVQESKNTPLPKRGFIKRKNHSTSEITLSFEQNKRVNHPMDNSVYDGKPIALKNTNSNTEYQRVIYAHNFEFHQQNSVLPLSFFEQQSSRSRSDQSKNDLQLPQNDYTMPQEMSEFYASENGMNSSVQQDSNIYSINDQFLEHEACENPQNIPASSQETENKFSFFQFLSENELSNIFDSYSEDPTLFDFIGTK